MCRAAAKALDMSAHKQRITKLGSAHGPARREEGRGRLVIGAVEGPGADGLEVEYGVVLECRGSCEGTGEDGLPDVGVCPEYLVHA